MPLPSPPPQVRDLRRLIELYSRWQERVFPYCSYDDFIAKLEKLSSSMLLRVRTDSASWERRAAATA